MPHPTQQPPLSLGVPLALHFFCQAVCRSFYTFACTAQLEARGWSQSTCGLIFGINELGILVVLPLSVFSIQKFGSRLAVHYGVFVVGVTFMLLGFADNYAGDEAFMFLSFMFRLAAGVCSTLAYMASFTLLLALPPRRSTYYLSFLVPHAFGLICGSLLGASAQEAARFEISYIALGFSAICVSYVVPCNLPLDADVDLLVTNHEILAPVQKILTRSFRLHTVRTGSIIVAVGSMCLSYINNTIGPFLLSELKFNPMEVWATFALLYCTAVLTACVVGSLCDRGAPPLLFTATGLICMLTGLFFIGPADSFEIPLSWSVGVMGVIAFGLGFATSFVSVFASLNQTLQTERESTNTICGVVTAVLVVSHVTGSLLGDVTFGFLADLVGFSNSAILAMFPILFALAVMTLQVCYASSENNLIALFDETKDAVSYGSIEESTGQLLPEKESVLF
ncbi:uncharacterized protein LOC135947673 [Cloeon dipterum]|uniref:uncharacterized protein LOC135947673 n=1 Tax=Cloeon dipterum TaxID=197152 RepID=UPI0032204FEE